MSTKRLQSDLNIDFQIFLKTLIRFLFNMSETSNRFETLEVQRCTVPVFKPRLFRCKIASLNVRTASTEDKLALVLRESNKAGLMVIGLQEFRWMQGRTVKNISGGANA